MLFEILYELKKLKWQLTHIFRFRKPLLKVLEYEKIVLSKNGVLVIHWKSCYSSYLKIPAINKCIFKNEGFVLIPLFSTDNIIIELCNTWHRQKFTIKLLPVDLRIEKPKETIIYFKNFKAAINFKSSLKKVKPDIFSFKIDNPQFSLNQFSFSVNDVFNSLNQS